MQLETLEIPETIEVGQPAEVKTLLREIAAQCAIHNLVNGILFPTDQLPSQVTWADAVAMLQRDPARWKGLGTPMVQAGVAAIVARVVCQFETNKLVLQRYLRFV